MIGCRRTKARRGEFRIHLPGGYVWDECEGILMDPDERARDAVNFFFSCFERIGTARGTVSYFEEHHLRFPRRDGWGSIKTVLNWSCLSPLRAVEILRNPIYPGVFHKIAIIQKRKMLKMYVWEGGFGYRILMRVIFR